MTSGERRDRWLRVQGAVTTALLLAVVGLAAWLSHRHAQSYDWTASGRNTLDPASAAVLERVEGPLSVTAWVRDRQVVRRAVAELIDRYRRVKPDIDLRIVDPDRRPDEARRLGVRADGELVVEWRGRREHVRRLGEAALSSAIERLLRREETWIAFLAGHGERDPRGGTRQDLRAFGAALEERGYRLRPLDLAAAGAVPENASLVVVAAPARDLLPGEAEALVEHVERGGNLLWLVEPGSAHGLGPLARRLGVQIAPGTIVDPTSRYPRVALVTGYPGHPAVADLEASTAFPTAAALLWERPPGWKATGLLATGLRAWAETGDLAGEIRFDSGADLPGPLDLAVALSRERPGGDGGPAEQRVVVVGDADFLSDAFAGTGGNLDLGLRLVRWLAHDDVLVSIPPRTAPDRRFEPGPAARAFIALGAPLLLPLALLATGLLVARRRRRR